MANDIFTLGIGRVIASGYAMRKCIPYLSWAYRKPLQWIKSHGIDLRHVLYINYETVSDFFNMNDTQTAETDEEKHYADMKEFFIENLKNLEFRPYMPFCSCCGSDKPVYIGMIPNAIKSIVSFAFCVNCRDEITLKKNALTCDV